MQLKFWRAEYDYSIDDAETFEVKNYDGLDDLEYAAEEYAEYFHDHRDGWECDWPVEFYIATMEGKILGMVSVERESMPVFSGSVK